MSLVGVSRMNLMRLIQIIMNFNLHHGEMGNLIDLATLYLQKVSRVKQAEHIQRNANT